jgi:6-pyruvoyltetrahydropterin/6-carboxytetrahydropterin synthase
MKWNIDKEFEFCYGHRVHSQVLDTPEYSINTMCKCRHLHGHQGKIKIGLSSDNLVNGMVTDFHNLNWFKKFLDDTLDHKFIIDINDPLFEQLTTLSKADSYPTNNEFGTYSTALLTDDSNPEMEELVQSFVIVDFVPTSENLSHWIFNLATQKMKGLGITVSYVDFWETPRSHCRVEA